MLKQFGHEIWTSDGPDIVIVGFHYPTRMAVIRLSDGRLLIWSPIELTDILRAEVDALGQVRRLIVAPNSLHHLFLPEWKRAYPGAKVYAPPGLRKKRKDIVFDADLGNAPDTDWASENPLSRIATIRPCDQPERRPNRRSQCAGWQERQPLG